MWAKELASRLAKAWGEVMQDLTQVPLGNEGPLERAFVRGLGEARSYEQPVLVPQSLQV
jgi:hypothetical protein